jgi:hypothetical protein
VVVGERDIRDRGASSGPTVARCVHVNRVVATIENIIVDGDVIDRAKIVLKEDRSALIFLIDQRIVLDKKRKLAGSGSTEVADIFRVRPGATIEVMNITIL